MKLSLLFWIPLALAGFVLMIRLAKTLFPGTIETVPFLIMLGIMAACMAGCLVMVLVVGQVFRGGMPPCGLRHRSWRE